MTWQRVLAIVCGLALIVCGFMGWQVQVAAVVVGLIIVGALSGELLAAFVRRVDPQRKERE